MTYKECVAQLNILFSTINSYNFTYIHIIRLNSITRLVVYNTNNPKEHVGCITDDYTAKYFALYADLIKAAIEAKK